VHRALYDVCIRYFVGKSEFIKLVVHDACDGIKIVMVIFFVFISIAQTVVFMSPLMVPEVY
jgi:hypothetical protein